MSDGCTWFVDVWRGVNIRQCCDVHDSDWASATDVVSWFGSNLQLSWCFLNLGVWELVIPAFILVSTIGTFIFFRPKGLVMSKNKNPVDAQVALEVAHDEGMLRQAYKDSVGVWTWSVGLTGATGHDVERYIDKPATLVRCIEVYVWALDNYADDVRSKFKDVVLTQAQFAAALKFHWNTGAIRSASWVNKFIAGDIEGAKKSFLEWDKPPEIIERRKREYELFFNGKWSGDGTVTEYTKVNKNHSPVWSSAIRRNISQELEAIFSKQRVVTEAVVSPVLPKPEPEGSSFWQRFIAALLLLFNRS